MYWDEQEMFGYVQFPIGYESIFFFFFSWVLNLKIFFFFYRSVTVDKYLTDELNFSEDTILEIYFSWNM